MMGLFGPEKIFLTLEKDSYKPGEVIKGTITLQLKKPIMARKIEVFLVGIAYYAASHHHSSHSAPSSDSNRIFYSGITLDGEKEYQNGSYTFEYKIPEEIFSTDMDTYLKLRGMDPNSRLENFVKNAAQGIGTVGETLPLRRIDWSVKANLDIPKHLDVHTSQPISLTP